MLASDLVQNKVYSDITDKEKPLQFTGKMWEFSEMNITRICAEFTPVKTDKNKNWYDSSPIIHICFDPSFGNQLVSKYITF